MLRVAVIYHMWPHYRRAIAIEMDRSQKIAYTFYGSGEEYEGIPHADVSAFRRFVLAPFQFLGRLMWQPQAIKVASNREYDAIVYLANPNFISTWVGATLAKLFHTPVLFWAHGWLKEDYGLRRVFRNLFFRRADHLLVYADRAKILGIKAGFSAENISVIYNSLDVVRAEEVISRIENKSLTSCHPRNLFSNPDQSLIICTARITELCRFDILFEASRILSARGTPINILLVGDGPARQDLGEMARKLDIAVHFFGPCYEEDILGQLIYHADVTVSPGKIGLTAMHSLMYGTPAITHNNLSEQMPEVEAIAEGLTGSLFAQGSASSLADKITDWFATKPSRESVRVACRKIIRDRWSPNVQARLIERAILETISNAAAGH